jgi:hypothetical protein
VPVSLEKLEEFLASRGLPGDTEKVLVHFPAHGLSSPTRTADWRGSVTSATHSNGACNYGRRSNNRLQRTALRPAAEPER